MSEYKCEKHKLDFACLGCIRAWMARHDKMLEFIREISKDEPCPDDKWIWVKAKELLKEINKL